MLHQHQQKLQQSKCKNCGKKFKKSRTTDRFCSSSCAYTSSKKPKRTPIKKKVSESNKTFHKVKMELAEAMADDPHCENCGIPTSNLDLHHIFYRSEVPHHTMLNDPINLIWVCRNCHEWLHETKDNRKNLVESRGLLEVFSKAGRYSDI